MMLEAKIFVKAGKDLYSVFLAEDKDFGSSRAGYDVFLEGDLLVVVVWAKDSVALRSVLNTVTKIITVYEKTSLVLEEL